MKKKPISEYPHMMAQWHPTKNPQFDVNETAAGLREKAWWLCPKCGYEWEALIDTRKASKGLCPNCEKDQRGPKTAKTIAMVPHLIDYWDYDANTDLDPHTLTATKNLYANWRCPKCGHKWSANIHSRYYDNTLCPACAGKVVTVTKNVVTEYPEIEKYYDKDVKGNPELWTLSKASRTMVHWKCPDCGHTWVQSVADRIRDGKVRGCAVCTGAGPVDTYENEFPELAKMYSSDNEVPFSELRSKDRHTKYRWNCPEGHIFESTLGSMMLLIDKPHRGCPECLGKVVAPPGKSVADLYPELLTEVNDDTDLSKVLPNSKKDVNWKCQECGYEWNATVVVRTNGFGKCPVCNNIHPVAGYNTVHALFYDIAKQWSPSNEKGPDELMPTSNEWVKIVCPDCGQEHSVQVKEATAGNVKCPYCNNKKVAPGVNSLDVTNPELIPLWSKVNTRDISTVASFMTLRAYWDCPDCDGTYPAEINKVVSGEAYCKYCADEALLPGYNSLDKTNPELESEWSPRNSLPMSQVKAYSWYRAYWICPVCGGEHLSTVKNHMEGADSCKYCEGVVPIPGVNSLSALRPDLLEQLAPENEVDPDTVFETYSLPLIWICEQGHHYARSPLLRLQDEAEGRESCPYCDDRLVLPGYNSFAARHPDLMKEWDEINNYVLADPDQISENSDERVWWKCMKNPDHDEYIMTVATRVLFKIRSRNPCPVCKGRRRKRQLFVPYKKK